MLKAAVTGELTRDWRERHKGEIKESGAELLARILKARRAAWEAAELKKLGARASRPGTTAGAEVQSPPAPDTAGLTDLPEEWIWASVDQLFRAARGHSKVGLSEAICSIASFKRQVTLCWGIDNVGHGKFMLGSQNRISQEKFNALQKYQARPADVLITVMASLGRSCVVPRNIEPALVTKHLYRMTIEQDLIIPVIP